MRMTRSTINQPRSPSILRRPGPILSNCLDICAEYAVIFNSWFLKLGRQRLEERAPSFCERESVIRTLSFHAATIVSVASVSAGCPLSFILSATILEGLPDSS